MIKVAVAVLLLLGDDPNLPWTTKPHPTDAPKRHVEEVTSAKHAYTVKQGGTMDGTNCRAPMGVGMSDGPAVQQTWESNRSVRMENIGDSDAVNPWLSNGRNAFRTLKEIVDAAVTPGMTDREKALAIWFQEIRYRYHFDGDNNELGDPVKIFNVYGHNTCGNDSGALAGLWRKAGLKVAPARLIGHCVTQAWFDNRWNLLDGDQHQIFLLRDNHTLAGEQDLVRDHDLIKRSHTQGILEPAGRAASEWEASIYVYQGEVRGDRNSVDGTTMNMVLRPQEAITWRWGHGATVKHHGQSKPKYPDAIYNGLWEYRPDFSKEVWRKGAVSVDGIRAKGGELSADEGKTGTIVWSLRAPYVLVGGKLEIEGSGAKFSVSWDGKTWQEAGSDLDALFPPAGAARYQYSLKCELSGDARLKRLGIVNDIQMAPMALPGMKVGENAFVYADQSTGDRKLRITHEWVERSTSRPPEAPAAAVAPADGAEASGTDLVFRWTPAKDPDGDPIADYQFELSDRADLKWPLSTNFYRLISKTADAGKAQYTLPGPGLLNSDRTYYWHVRAKDDKGVWGPWSKTWRLTPKAPATPVEVAIVFDEAKQVGVLRWKPGPAAKYRVYGSDEKGFTASDVPYKVNIGISKELPGTFAANFVTETEATELAVVGRGLSNYAYYRVVAVDAQGSRSGPSDYAGSVGGFISSKPVTKAKSGSEYRYVLSVIRSLGDLRSRVIDGRETMNFWDIERPKFAIVKGPAWLKIDEKTGVLTGTPTQAGKVEVSVSATLERESRELDEKSLVWGVEKVVSSDLKKVAGGTQEFALEVAP